MKIKPFLILLVALFPFLGFGQGHPTGLSSPILTNFWIRDFDIDVTRPNTQLLKLNLNSQQFDNGGSTITITNFGNASGGTNVFNTIYVSNVFTTNITVLNNTVTSNLFVTNLFVTNLTVFDTTITSNLFVTNITANTIITTNLFVTNLFVTYEVVSNVVAGNIQGTPPHLAMFRPDNFSVADSIVTQNADTNGVTVNGNGDGSVTLGGANNPFVEFGDGGTNIFRKVGRALVYTNNDNGAHLVSIDVQNNNGGIGQFGVNGNSASISPSGTANLVDIGDNAGGHFIWTANTAYPFSLGDLGKFGGSYPPSPWRDINSARTNYIWGYYGAISTNFSYAAIAHNGTNASIVFNSQSSGIAGEPRPVVFGFNGTNQLTLTEWGGIALGPNTSNFLSGFTKFQLLSSYRNTAGGDPGQSIIQIQTANSGAGTFGDLTINETSTGIEMDLDSGNGGNTSAIKVSSNGGTDTTLEFDVTGNPTITLSAASGTAVFNGNVGAKLTAGDTTFVNMQKATQTNQLSGALTFAHATNGTDRVEWTHRRYLFNPSGADRLITLPAGWHNISGATFTVTNSTMARLDVTSWGDTSSSALQTNVSSVVTFMP